ncbi:phage GP46 family protein [Budviciaceae bacterium BWR-B9]|uniref:Phage GP46 family protein n=1 Tax=Limnobaculum allomyrinae TaxID=2791986 RepID=A0ABS1IXT5_9GAMM|nr:MULTISPECIES: phage GP46 family protein [Limnobaculum]MBK5146005.1 phage GP46 family protein [Limnobaculum allomyrinae]MBV7694024.1 phage GP46 family protein [Limnobaculum sp. M2-1]
MSDITTVWQVDESIGDWLKSKLSGGDLLTGHDLETSILISLFTDRQARDDDMIEDFDRRGWWGDYESEYLIGSRLWLLRRQKLTTKVAIKAEDYAKEALEWLIKDGVASFIDVSAQIIHPATLILTISYQQPSKKKQSVKYSWVWGDVTNAI